MYVCNACGLKLSELQASCPECGCLFANYSTVQRRLAKAAEGQSQTQRNQLFLSLVALTVLLIVLLVWRLF